MGVRTCSFFKSCNPFRFEFQRGQLSLRLSYKKKSNHFHQYYHHENKLFLNYFRHLTQNLFSPSILIKNRYYIMPLYANSISYSFFQNIPNDLYFMLSSVPEIFVSLFLSTAFFINLIKYYHCHLVFDHFKSDFRYYFPFCRYLL